MTSNATEKVMDAAVEKLSPNSEIEECESSCSSKHILVIQYSNGNQNFDIFQEGKIPKGVTKLLTSHDFQILQQTKAQLENDVFVHMDGRVLLNSTDSTRPISKQKSSSHELSTEDGFNESDEEPFADNGTDDEYAPNSFSSSSDDESESLRTQIRHCRRVLFSPETSTEIKLLPEEDNTNADCSTSSFCRRDDAKSVSISPIGKNELFNVAHFTIDLKTSAVTMMTETVFHQGSYDCNLIRENEKLLGFVHSELPERGHKCFTVDKSNTTTSIVLLRYIGTDTAKVAVQTCVPPASLSGIEVHLRDIGTTPLLIRHLRFDKNKNQRKRGAVKGKLHCCIFCEKMFVEISAHLIRIHSDEKEIKNILQMKINSKERNTALRKLRTKGDDNYNKRVSSLDRIPIRRHEKLDMENAVTCQKCRSLLAAKNFARHERRCTGRPSNRKRVVTAARQAECMRFSQLKMKDRVLDDLLSKLNADAILHTIVSDSCLKLAAERYAFMHRSQPTALKNDRQHLRRMARLLLELKELEPSIIDYEDFFLYGDYDVMVQAVFNMCALNAETGAFGKPALARVLRSSITFLLEALFNSYTKKGYAKTSLECENLQRFINMHEKNYGIYIGRSAGRNVLQRKAEKISNLPTSKDVKLFSQYIFELSNKAYNDLRQNGFSYDSWLRLGKAELVKIILFNRRRVSEVSSMTLTLYKQKVSLDENKKSSLTVLEKALADRYMTMKLIGKREHILNVLIDEDQCKHLNCFITYRKEAGVPDCNTYLFGVPTTGLYIDASNAIREFSIKCGASNPHLLRSTYLRKQVATLSQLLTMNDNQIGQIAKLMGHSQKVHEQVYRQDENLFQVTAWAKFLNIINDEDINKYRGKTFEEIVNAAESLEDVEDDVRQIDHLAIDEILKDSSKLVLDPTTEEVSSVEELLNSTTEGETIMKENEIQFRDVKKKAESKKRRGKQSEQDINQKTVAMFSSNRFLKIRSINTRKGSSKLAPNSSKVTPKKHTQAKTTPVKHSPGSTIATLLNTIACSPPKNKIKKRVSFTSSEVQIMQRHFAQYYRKGHLAPQNECDKVLEDNPGVFQEGRCGRDLYNWVQYQRNKCRKVK